MSRWVVLRPYTGVMVWYVEAADAARAVERVWPAEPDRSPTFVDNGGMEAPYMEAHTDTTSDPWALPIRRVPGRVAVAYGEEDVRYVGPQGER